MIKVLQDEQEILKAIQWLRERGILQHTEKSKNFDLMTIYNLLDSVPRNISIVDLGCGPSKYGCVTLNSLAKAGFKNLVGIDLCVPWYARCGNLIAFLRYGIWKNKYILKKGDICKTGLPRASVDFAIMLSVIEHGVPLKDLVKELARIVRHGGLIYISTDYWPGGLGEAQIIRTGSSRNIPMSWKVFGLEDIKNLIELANDVGLILKTSMDIPAADRAVVIWHNNSYTFISLVFKNIGNLD